MSNNRVFRYTKKEIKVVSEAQTTLINQPCCLCDASPKTLDGDGCEHADWADETYDREHVVVRYEEGYRYPEGGEIERQTWDICPKCFNEKIRPMLPEPYIETFDI